MNKKIKIEPIYGWGWVCKDSTIEEPAIFDIEVHSESENEITGTVTTPNHLLTGFYFHAYSSHTPNDGYYNCEMTLHPDTKIYGYCKISKISLGT